MFKKFTKYAKKQAIAQKKDTPTTTSILDSSSQSESLQRKADIANNATQRAEAPRPNNTGMPDNLKSGIESLSGFSMDDVRVHYNSSKPATVQALAYTQGTDIHVAPGQEKHLPHEAWHVAQQMAGRVSPTTNINGMPVNDNAGLEHEADVMGEKAVQCKMIGVSLANGIVQCSSVQRMAFYNPDSPSETTQIEGKALFGRVEGQIRSPKLAAFVDLYKKEMLTRIAVKIQNLCDVDVGPHISVAITGRQWFIAINTLKEIYGEDGGRHKGVNVETIGKLRECAISALKQIQTEYEKVCNSLREKYEVKDGENIENINFETADKKNDDCLKEQALYIAYRWACCSLPPIVTNKEDEFHDDVTAKDPRSKHGEMQTIDFLNGPTSWGWRKREVPVEYTKEKRVVRIGGTKTPCFDCAEEIYRKGGSHTPNKNGTERKKRDEVKGRQVVTMTSGFGDAFDNWHGEGWDRKKENDVFINGLDCFQEQGYRGLLTSFLKLCDKGEDPENIQKIIERIDRYRNELKGEKEKIWSVPSSAEEVEKEFLFRFKRVLDKLAQSLGLNVGESFDAVLKKIDKNKEYVLLFEKMEPIYKRFRKNEEIKKAKAKGLAKVQTAEEITNADLYGEVCEIFKDKVFFSIPKTGAENVGKKYSDEDYGVVLNKIFSDFYSYKTTESRISILLKKNADIIKLYESSKQKMEEKLKVKYVSELKEIILKPMNNLVDDLVGYKLNEKLGDGEIEISLKNVSASLNQVKGDESIAIFFAVDQFNQNVDIFLNKCIFAYECKSGLMSKLQK